MQKVMLDDLVYYLNRKIKRTVFSTTCTLSNFKVFNEGYRKSPEYTDPTYYPFYYYLGKVISPNNLLEIGFETGIQVGYFLKSCFDVENIFAFHQKQKDVWTYRIPCSNIVNVIKKKINWWDGSIDDSEFIKYFLMRKWDCVFITKPFKTKEMNKKILNLCWQQMAANSFLFLDNVKDLTILSAYKDFCNVVNRVPNIINTRNGIGVIDK